MIRRIACFIALLLCLDAGAISYIFQHGKGLELSWQTDDRVGITTGKESYGEMEQLSFWISSTASAVRNERNIYSVGYKLNTDITYYSYSPYRWFETFDARNIQCRYDQQTQDGNDNTTDLCDYQIAASCFVNNACTLAYAHVGGILRVSFTAPSDMSIASLSIVAPSEKIATVTSMNIISKEVKNEKYESALTIETKNLNAEKGKEIVIYIACPPQDLSTTPLSITVTDQNGSQTTIAEVMGPDVKAGFVYDMALTKTTRAANTLKAAFDFAAHSAPLSTVAISTPLARIEDFPLDDSYICTSSVLVESNKTKDNNFYTLQGTRAKNKRKGETYIHKGQKIIW